MKCTYALLVTFVMLSCKKEKDSVTSLVGKWKLIEYYYVLSVGGGCMCWESIEQQSAPTLQFFLTARYELTYPNYLSIPGCSGNYRIVNDSRLVMTYECISALTGVVPGKTNCAFSKDGNILTITDEIHGNLVEYIINKYKKM